MSVSRSRPLLFCYKCPLPQERMVETSVFHVFFAMIAPITAPAMIAVLTLPCEYFLPPLRFLRPPHASCCTSARPSMPVYAARSCCGTLSG
nr:MAG TPA: hypothetical protein [Caudoviricetes sp.]